MHFIIEVIVIYMMATGFKIWISKVGTGTLPASGFTNIQYYGVIGIGILFSALELLCEIIDLGVKKEGEEAK
jgi:TRAP-type C4-dicarboxylate transport system permease small subunit